MLIYLKILKIVVSIFSPILVVGLLILSSPLPLSAQQDVEFERDTLSIVARRGDVFEFNVELAETSEQKSRGLMFRREMADNEGMLFLHRRDRVLTMWMANTFLPLDMLFIERDGTIARIEENTIPQSRDVISSRKRVRAVLELNAGTARNLGISAGDKVVYERFNQL
jgi:uncharacterized membrane protein (UPF0127 family)